MPACPGLVCFFDGVVPRGLGNFVFDVCVCFVLCRYVYRTDCVFKKKKDLWFDDLRAE